MGNPLTPSAVTLFVFALASSLAASTTTVQRDGTTPVTFTRDVAPIVFRNCSSCHNPNGPGPFALLTYDDVASHADRIQRVTQGRYMPPWLPDSGIGDFVGERRLSTEDIATITRWIEGGLLVGDSADLPPPPDLGSEWRLGAPDLILSATRFELPPHDQDVYRNLVIPIPIDGTRFVRSVELRPGGTHVVHHARMMVDSTNSSRLLDQEDAGPGFDGMHLISNATNPDGFFVGWTPGKMPFQSPPDMSWRVEPGTDLVLQLHLPASDTAQVVEPTIGMYFAAKPPSRKPVLIMLGAFDIDIPPGAAEYTVTDEYLLPVDVAALAVYPHAHYLGKKIEGFARLPNGNVKWLLRISNWDFNWQDEYHLAKPVDLPAGSRLTMRITYDNSATNPRNPNHPPRRVVYGSNSTDEMGDLVVQVLPKRAGDLAALQRDVDVWQYTTMIRQMGRMAHQEGLALSAEGKLAEAIDRFREAISYVNDDPPTHNDLGSALALTGYTEQAAAHFREASRLDPNWAEPAANLAITLLAVGTPEATEEALASARRAARLTNRTDPAVLDILASALAGSGKMQEAIETAERALELAVAQSRADLAGKIREKLAGWREDRRTGGQADGTEADGRTGGRRSDTPHRRLSRFFVEPFPPIPS